MFLLYIGYLFILVPASENKEQDLLTDLLVLHAGQSHPAGQRYFLSNSTPS